jgi:hypothetical protein
MVKNFLFCTSSRSVLGLAQSPIQWVLGGYFPEGKAGGGEREADYSLPINDEVKKTWTYTSTSS